MESLLTLSGGEYSSVELTLRLSMALSAMAALLLALSAASVPPRSRLPLFLGAVALGGGALFESFVWTAWKGAFELAGGSYCVTGLPLDQAGRVVAWALGVPGLLLALGMARGMGGIAWGKEGGFLLERLAVASVALSLVSLIAAKTALLLLLYAGYLLCVRIPRSNRRPAPLFYPGDVAVFATVLVGSVLRILAGTTALPLGAGAGERLVQGELLGSVGEMLCLLPPAALLLVRVLRR
jgi:hypothetical protein